MSASRQRSGTRSDVTGAVASALRVGHLTAHSVGSAAGDKDLERERKADQAGAKVKHTAEKVKEKIDDAVDAVKENSTGSR
jgi:uncharacterized protein YjbJ (UPF0337 family)